MSTGSGLPVQAVLFDRDGTLVADVPYNGDPHRVRLLPRAARSVAFARAAGLATAVVSNQSGIGRGLLTTAQVDAVNARADRLLGGLDAWLYCPHAPEAGCPCRKPRPGLILAAAARLGVSPARCLVIGDIAADIEAAHAAGARAVLVPNPATAPDEITRYAPLTAPDLLTALRTALGRRADAGAGIAPACEPADAGGRAIACAGAPDGPRATSPRPEGRHAEVPGPLARGRSDTGPNGLSGSGESARSAHGFLVPDGSAPSLHGSLARGAGDGLRRQDGGGPETRGAGVRRDGRWPR
ncbi:D-glycero-alpha-D-manno-heptose-1,7-bisphosphate 7-phosphatase [Streptomyces sp. NPDC003007]